MTRSISIYDFNVHERDMQCIANFIQKKMFLNKSSSNNIIYKFKNMETNYYSNDVLIELKKLSKNDIETMLQNQKYLDYDCLINFLNIVAENNKDIDYKFLKYCYNKYLIEPYSTNKEFLKYYETKIGIFNKNLLIKHIEFLKDYKDINTINFIKEKTKISNENKLLEFDTLKNLSIEDLYIINNNLLVSKKMLNSIYETQDICENFEQNIILENLKLCNDILIDKHNVHLCLK